MSERTDRIDREIARERAQVRERERELERRRRLLDEMIAGGLTTMADTEREMLRILEQGIEDERARIAGKYEVRDKPGNVTTGELIERENRALDELRRRRDALAGKQNRTPAEDADLARLNRQIVLEGKKIEGKELAGRAAGEYAMGPAETPGSYKVAVFDPLGREIVAFLLPTAGLPLVLGARSADLAKMQPLERPRRERPARAKALRPTARRRRG